MHLVCEGLKTTLYILYILFAHFAHLPKNLIYKVFQTYGFIVTTFLRKDNAHDRILQTIYAEPGMGRQKTTATCHR